MLSVVHLLVPDLLILSLGDAELDHVPHVMSSVDPIVEVFVTP